MCTFSACAFDQSGPSVLKNRHLHSGRIVCSESENAVPNCIDSIEVRVFDGLLYCCMVASPAVNFKEKSYLYCIQKKNVYVRTLQAKVNFHMVS